MINQELIDFIKKSRTAGQADEQIKSLLLSKGWSEADINEGFNSSQPTVANYYDTSSNDLQSKLEMEPKKSSKKIVIYVILGLVIIVGIIYFMGLNSAKKFAQSNIDQANFTVDVTCAVYHSANETNIWNIDISNMTFDEVSSQNPTFYRSLEPRLQQIMQKYNLDHDSLEQEHKKATLLMQTDSSFKKKVTDQYLKSRCLPNTQ